MLNLLRDQQNNYHTTRLEWIVIILIVVEVGCPYLHDINVHVDVICHLGYCHEGPWCTFSCILSLSALLAVGLSVY